MIDPRREEEAKRNISRYLEEGLLKKERNELALARYIKNADLSIKVAYGLQKDPLKPYLWVVVISYYSMFYMANAVLLSLGYKTQDKITHKVTSDALIALVLDRLKRSLLEDFCDTQQDALEALGTKAETIIGSYALEREKRSRFQYDMLEQTKEAKAMTSLSRASSFNFEMKRLMKGRA